MNRLIENIISIPLWPFLFVPTMTHWSMTKGDVFVKKLKKSSYQEIKERMLAVEWEVKVDHPWSLFDKKDFYKNYFHASIFRFNGVGYLLTPYGYIRATLLQRKIRRMITGSNDGKQYVK